MFVHRPKTINVICVYAPYRALMTSRKVCALGALRFSSMASVANSRICTVAPEAYQKGPETPYLYATPDDCNNVAAHVHDDTTADATNPVFTVRPAVLNISDVWTSFWYLRYRGLISSVFFFYLPLLRRMGFWYLFRAHVVPIIPRANANPSPRTMPYPKPCDSGGLYETATESILKLCVLNLQSPLN